MKNSKNSKNSKKKIKNYKNKKGGSNNNNNLIISPFETNNIPSDIPSNILPNELLKHKKQILKLKPKYTKTKQIKRDSNNANDSNLIGQGTYGCVYKPPLKCKNPESCPENNNKCRTGISKLMGYTNDVDEELKIYAETEIDKINSNSLYHIKEPRRCKPNDNNVQKAKNDGCKIDLDEPELLIYENGGIDLEKAIENEMSPIKILFNFANIFKAVITLYSNDIGHCDIKLRNIVVGTDTQKPHYRLIDLGLTRKFSKSINSENNNIFLQTYYVWPPDSIFLTKEHFNEHDIHKYVNKFIKDIIIIDDYYKSRGWMKSDFLIQMVKLSNLSVDNSLIKNRKQQYSLLTRSFDVYGLGACIFDMIKWFKKFVANPSKYYLANPEYHKEAELAINLLSNYLDNSDLLHPSAIFRPSPELAYQLYKNNVTLQIK